MGYFQSLQFYLWQAVHSVVNRWDTRLIITAANPLVDVRRIVERTYLSWREQGRHVVQTIAFKREELSKAHFWTASRESQVSNRCEVIQILHTKRKIRIGLAQIKVQNECINYSIAIRNRGFFFLRVSEKFCTNINFRYAGSVSRATLLTE